MAEPPEDAGVESLPTGRFRIKRLERWMDDRILSRQGLSIRQIAVLRGGSRNAVRRALRSAAPTTVKRCRAKSVALERYIRQITAWLRDEVTMLWTAERASSRDSKSTAMMVAAPFHRLSRGRAFRSDRLQRHAPVHRFRAGSVETREAARASIGKGPQRGRQRAAPQLSPARSATA
jgi:hypothetical protein